MLLDKVDFTNSKAKDRKRVGRGISAGGGKTAGRGTKGQKSRSGYSRRQGFEGGQTPLFRRLPKLRGFKSVTRPTQEVNVNKLHRVSGKKVNLQSLHAAGLIDNQNAKVKLIGNGELKTAYTVEFDNLTAGAKKSITAAGGSVSTPSN